MTASGRALMTGLIDYAGLFPPAALDMLSAVRHYGGYLAGPDKWALGRFVVPAVRLREFEAAFDEVCCGEREPIWPLSVLSHGDLVGGSKAIDELVQGAVAVKSIEIKATSSGVSSQFLSKWSRAQKAIPVYVEFPSVESRSMLPVLAAAGARAKIRTGGLVAGAFPPPE
ncbi:MAG: hypothetical protein ACRD3F_11215, partial [Acidobacteriaceae bacterium]